MNVFTLTLINEQPCVGEDVEEREPGWFPGFFVQWNQKMNPQMEGGTAKVNILLKNKYRFPHGEGERISQHRLPSGEGEKVSLSPCFHGLLIR